MLLSFTVISEKNLKKCIFAVIIVKLLKLFFFWVILEKRRYFMKNRDVYLKQLISFRDKPLIKVITGIRR